MGGLLNEDRSIDWYNPYVELLGNHYKNLKCVYFLIQEFYFQEFFFMIIFRKLT